MKSLQEILGSCRIVVVEPDANPFRINGRRFEKLLQRHEIDRVQRFRGGVYVDDGAIPVTTLDETGRHASEFDHRCHHILIVDASDQIRASVRVGFYLKPVEPEELELWRLVETLEPAHGARVRRLLAIHLERAFRERGSLIEVGGFALESGIRRSGKALVLAAACWSITRVLAPSLGVAIVTERHGFNRLLTRLGGFPIDGALGLRDASRNGNPGAKFFSSLHNCTVELLGFDTWQADSQIESLVNTISGILASTTTVPSNVT